MIRRPVEDLPPAEPGAYGLTRAELEHEVTRLKAAGWASWEIAAALRNPAEVAA